MMKTKILVIMAAMTLGSIIPAMGATNTFNVTAEVRAQISIGAISALNFGIIEQPAGITPITVIPAAGTQSGSIFGGALAASSAVTAQVGSPFLASVTPTTVTVGDGTNTMSVGTFVVACPGCGGGGTTFNAGPNTFYIGATLSVGATQATGAYAANAVNGSGLATLTIVYQ